MSLFELVVLSAALGTDLFSVAIPIGMNGVRWRVILRSAAVFAAFHIAMILGGYYFGHWLGTVVDHVGTYHIDWPAAAVQDWASAFGALMLAGIGAHMVKENLSRTVRSGAGHRLQGMAIVGVAVGVSVDALAAGVGLGMMDVDLIKLSLILGSVIFAVAVTGLVLGRRLGRLIGERAELVGGCVLVVLAVHILWTSLT